MEYIDKKEFENYVNNFMKNIKFERNSLGWTQAEVAKRLGISKQSYNAYESGTAYPTFDNLLKLSMIFHVSLNDLFEIDY